jgi:hypothetical protein
VRRRLVERGGFLGGDVGRSEDLSESVFVCVGEATTPRQACGGRGWRNLREHARHTAEGRSQPAVRRQMLSARIGERQGCSDAWAVREREETNRWATVLRGLSDRPRRSAR